MKHFIDLITLDKADLRAILDDAHAAKAARRDTGPGGDATPWPKGKPDAGAPLADHTLAMVFEKSSTRTRFSFDMAMRQLGGSSITATANDMQLGRGETVEDTARVLSRYVDAVMLRVNDHADLEAFADAASIPVINGLSDRSHPCQIMADLLTLEEHGHDLSSARLAWLGDGNNVCASFIHAAAKFGFELAIGTPARYAPDEDDLDMAAAFQARVALYDTAEEAAAGADVVIADTFVSMGDDDADTRLAELDPFAVTDELMALAAPKAHFIHCLPAHRGEEVDAEIIDGPQSLVWDEAENRVHAQKAILKWCLGKL
ncbi:MAG: ornithine carbamoyltransferase [Pseudomonadota bacterium]